ncbi:MAG: CoA transferase [Patulibacter sp.]|nr:CoA transferase [Patulibacter sp.]
MTGDPDRPLAGTTVLEWGPLLPVPSAGAALARLGADVTRLQPPTGDPARTLYGGWLHELYGVGKRAATLDLASDAGREHRDALLDAADVVIVGHRPSSARRAGLDAATVRRDRPGVVHCSIVGFPTDGPDADRPGHDLSFLARSGALAVPATPSAVGAAPRRPAIPIADLAAGAVAVQAILAALIGRDRGHGGRALEVSIDEVVRGWMAPRLGPAVAPTFPAALDPANDLYQGADGRWLVVAAIERRFWTALAAALGRRVALPAAAEGWGSAERIAAGDALAAPIRTAFARESVATWLAELEAAGVPVDELLDAEGVVARHGDDVAVWRDVATPLRYAEPQCGSRSQGKPTALHSAGLPPRATEPNEGDR